jgi:hypothetical protein
VVIMLMSMMVIMLVVVMVAGLMLLHNLAQHGSQSVGMQRSRPCCQWAGPTCTSADQLSKDTCSATRMQQQACMRAVCCAICRRRAVRGSLRLRVE